MLFDAFWVAFIHDDDDGAPIPITWFFWIILIGPIVTLHVLAVVAVVRWWKDRQLY